MILKWIGSAIVIVSCGGMGFYFGAEVERRIRELRQLREILFLLRGDVRYMRSPLPEAIGRIGERESGMWGRFFASVAEELAGFDVPDFGQVFDRRINEIRKETALNRQDLELLARFGEMLGKMDMEMQLNAFDWYLEQSGERLDQLVGQADKQITLHKSMGILAGVFLLIVLL